MQNIWNNYQNCCEGWATECFRMYISRFEQLYALKHIVQIPADTCVSADVAQTKITKSAHSYIGIDFPLSIDGYLIIIHFLFLRIMLLKQWRRDCKSFNIDSFTFD